VGGWACIYVYVCFLCEQELLCVRGMLCEEKNGKKRVCVYVCVYVCIYIYIYMRINSDIYIFRIYVCRMYTHIYTHI